MRVSVLRGKDQIWKFPGLCRSFKNIVHMNKHNLTIKSSAETQSVYHYTELTLNYYDKVSESYWLGTQTHDVSQNISALMNAINGSPPFTIVDLGCGPGRDLKTFRELGHQAIGIDGSSSLADMATKYSGCEVWHQNFLELDFARVNLDGVFANASLFHVPRTVLPNVLRKIYTALKKGGVLFCSNPRGNNEERFTNGRYGCFYDLATWRDYLLSTGFIELDHYYRPSGLPRASQPWLATLWRK